MAKHPLDTIRAIDPTLINQLDGLRSSAMEGGTIPLKYKLLTAMAIDVTVHSENGIKSLATQALAAGATKEEIAETLRIAAWINGAGCIYTAARALEGII